MIPLFLLNCADEEKPSYSASISGRLIDSCGGSPIGGQQLELWDLGKARNVLIPAIERHLEGETITDSEGRFEFKINETFSGNKFAIVLNTYEIAEGNRSPSDGENLDIMDVFGQATFVPVKFKFHKGLDWLPTENVIIRHLLYEPFRTIDDTFNIENATASGKNLYATGRARVWKLIQTDSLPHFSDRTIVKWNTKKEDDYQDEFFKIPGCGIDTNSFTVMPL